MGSWGRRRTRSAFGDVEYFVNCVAGGECDRNYVAETGLSFEIGDQLIVGYFYWFY